MEDYEIEQSEILQKCRGYTLKLSHPAIKKNKEYQIHAFRRMKGKFGEFFMLYCYLPESEKYQRVFSNSKLTDYILQSMPFWTRYEPEDGNGNIMIWNESTEMIMKFYPGEMATWNGNNYRKITFDIGKP